MVGILAALTRNLAVRGGTWQAVAVFSDDFVAQVRENRHRPGVEEVAEKGPATVSLSAKETRKRGCSCALCGGSDQPDIIADVLRAETVGLEVCGLRRGDVGKPGEPAAKPGDPEGAKGTVSVVDQHRVTHPSRVGEQSVQCAGSRVSAGLVAGTLKAMKVARFAQKSGEPQFGIVDESDLVVLTGDPLYHGIDTTGERVPLESVKLLAPVIPRSKVICVGMNYAEHKADMGHEGPDNPLVFLKPNTSVVGPGEPIVIPPVPGRIVHEGELAVVIGSVAKRVARDDWESVVFGYTIANDVSARDVMFADGQWARAKGYDSFCPLGPWIETELDPGNQHITTYVSGEKRREGSTKDLIYSIPEIIEFVSDVWTLLPGDVICTGTPSGLGGFHAGDTVDITIDGIGTLSNPAVNRDDRRDD